MFPVLRDMDSGGSGRDPFVFAPDKTDPRDLGGITTRFLAVPHCDTNDERYYQLCGLKASVGNSLRPHQLLGPVGAAGRRGPWQVEWAAKRLALVSPCGAYKRVIVAGQVPPVFETDCGHQYICTPQLSPDGRTWPVGVSGGLPMVQLLLQDLVVGLEREEYMEVYIV